MTRRAENEWAGVEIDIAELVLEGLPETDRHAVAVAVQEELARLFEAKPIAQRTPVSDELVSEAPHALGSQIGQVIHGHIIREAVDCRAAPDHSPVAGRIGGPPV